ncbi:DUF5590 domain-containing protein [Sporosarcina sp. Te-1]|uniref:cell wall elongation regulator TseB-like domain-containing protein n=1 Tax=Sporosarcina sp. Te-1 TaxID=2818390 RepID=UPI001A9D69F8|nr:DUF5590 domain-containing protein [Sporosarcina sp. Te-1]QTD42155.1 DUF5590 domain-containing protein [Sporosarcina sp. Te-1]
MLNWIKFITAFLLALGIAIFVLVFYNANKPYSAAVEKSSEVAVTSGKLATAERSETYNGTTSLVTVYGKDEDGKEKAVFISDKGKVVGEVAMADGISSEKAIDAVKKELKVDKILHVSLGLEENHPIWEVAFRSENGKLNYVYVFFENGQWWKRILNL